MRLSLLSILASCSVVPQMQPAPDLEAEIARLDGEIASLRSEVALLRAVPVPPAPVAPERICVPSELEELLLNSPNPYKSRALLHLSADGEPDGYRLSAIRSTDLLYQLGIRSGDVIQRVNGEPITSIQASTALYQRYLREGAPEHATLDLLRKGQPYRLELQFGSCSR